MREAYHWSEKLNHRTKSTFWEVKLAKYIEYYSISEMKSMNHLDTKDIFLANKMQFNALLIFLKKITLRQSDVCKIPNPHAKSTFYHWRILINVETKIWNLSPTATIELTNPHAVHFGSSLIPKIINFIGKVQLWYYRLRNSFTYMTSVPQDAHLTFSLENTSKDPSERYTSPSKTSQILLISSSKQRDWQSIHILCSDVEN